MVTRTEIARWMLRRLEGQGWLDRHEVVAYLRDELGGAFVHRTKYGQGTLNDRLLAEFRALTPAGVVWSRRERCWRLARPGDTGTARMAE